jgi:hypothetical protein
MLNELDYTEYIGWVEHFSIYPFKEERADIRNAMLCFYIVKNGADPKKSKKLKVTDFLPQYVKREPKAESWQKILKYIKVVDEAIHKDERRDSN